MWQGLIDILNELNKTYGMAREIAEKKHGALVCVDMDMLSKLVDRERELTPRIQELESRRKEVLLRLSQAIPKADPEMKVSELIRFAPTKPYAVVLEKLFKALEANVKKVQELGENNEILAEAALQAVTFHLNRLGGAAVEPAYGGKGQEVVTSTKTQLEVQA